MITSARGNLLECDVDALVTQTATDGNPPVDAGDHSVDEALCRLFPDMAEDRARAARRGELRVGRVHVWPTQRVSGPRYVLSLPTSEPGRDGQLCAIGAALDELVTVADELGILSLALPPVGRDRPGHDAVATSSPEAVDDLVARCLSRLPGRDILLVDPDGAADPSRAIVRGAISPGRAAVVEVMARFAERAHSNPSLTEAQPLLYFLQTAGEPLRLAYARHPHGPYADNLRHLLLEVEATYLDAARSVTRMRSNEPVTLFKGARDAAATVLARRPETANRVERVMDLVAGYESGVALELLATVHWWVHERPELAADPEGTVEAVLRRSARTGGLFTPRRIVAAWTALHERGWVHPLPAA